MADWDRGIPWRQGNFITAENAVGLKLIVSENSGRNIPIIISHDCDIAKAPETEPQVEIMVGTRIAAVDGNYTHSKNPRKLHLRVRDRDGDFGLELLATGKRLVSKQQLVSYEPYTAITLLPKELLILQRWLAARYHRSAFPDEFDRRLQENDLHNKLVKILKPLGRDVIAAFFDIDAGKSIERKGPKDTYGLSIYLLYSTESNPQTAESETQSAADSIAEAFRSIYFDSSKKVWQQIELIDCMAISDQVMTYAMALQLRKWNIDYLSFRTEPAQPVLSD